MLENFDSLLISKEVCKAIDYKAAALYGLILQSEPWVNIDTIMDPVYWDCSATTTTKYTKLLLEQGFIDRMSNHPYKVAEILQSKDNKGKGIGEQVCSWCGIKTLAPQEHHFPIKESDGGTETVLLCACCHWEYHYIEDAFFVPNKPDLSEYMVG